MTNFNALIEKLEKNDDVITVRMAQLREASGARKLSSGVIEELQTGLDTHSIGFYPSLKSDQNVKIRIYKKGSLIGNLIEAVKMMGEETDTILRKHVSKERAKIIENIRQLLEHD